MIFFLESYMGKKVWLIIPSPCIFSLQYTTLPYYSYIQSYVEVTVNTCTCMYRHNYSI